MSKKCRICKTAFEPTKPMQSVCGFGCAVDLALKARVKSEKAAQVKERKADRAQREKMKSKAQWAREAQAAFNGFIRERDADLPCISCGRHHSGQYHAGHYLSVGARPELRFVESNVHKQCAPCNTHLSGNAVLFRIGLISRIGTASVEWLEGPHDPTRYTIDNLKQIKQVYTSAAKQLKEANQ